MDKIKNLKKKNLQRKIYINPQSVHMTTMEMCCKRSIENLLGSNDPYVKFETTGDKYADNLVWRILELSDIHSKMLISCAEVFQLVWNRIHAYSEKINLLRKNDLEENTPAESCQDTFKQIKRLIKNLFISKAKLKCKEINSKSDILQRFIQEIVDSENMCMTGKITRLVNSLVGFCDDIQIQPDDPEIIFQVINDILTAHGTKLEWFGQLDRERQETIIYYLRLELEKIVNSAQVYAYIDALT